jgi:hypothetical protein
VGVSVGRELPEKLTVTLLTLLNVLLIVMLRDVLGEIESISVLLCENSPVLVREAAIEAVKKRVSLEVGVADTEIEGECETVGDAVGCCDKENDELRLR